MTLTTPLVRNAEEAERRWFYGGGLHSWLVRESEAGDGFLLFEDIGRARQAHALHVHPEAEETFYLLAGSILLHVDGHEHDLRTGGVAVVPRRCRMRSWPGPTERACSACTPRAVARTSTGPPASPHSRASRHSPSTSTASAGRRGDRQHADRRTATLLTTGAPGRARIARSAR